MRRKAWAGVVRARWSLMVEGRRFGWMV